MRSISRWLTRRRSSEHHTRLLGEQQNDEEVVERVEQHAERKVPLLPTFALETCPKSATFSNNGNTVLVHVGDEIMAFRFHLPELPTSVRVWSSEDALVWRTRVVPHARITASQCSDNWVECEADGTSMRLWQRNELRFELRVLRGSRVVSLLFVQWEHREYLLVVTNHVVKAYCMLRGILVVRLHVPTTLCRATLQGSSRIIFGFTNAKAVVVDIAVLFRVESELVAVASPLQQVPTNHDEQAGVKIRVQAQPGARVSWRIGTDLALAKARELPRFSRAVTGGDEDHLVCLLHENPYETPLVIVASVYAVSPRCEDDAGQGYGMHLLAELAAGPSKTNVWREAAWAGGFVWVFWTDTQLVTWDCIRGARQIVTFNDRIACVQILQQRPPAPNDVRVVLQPSAAAGSCRVLTFPLWCCALGRDLVGWGCTRSATRLHFHEVNLEGLDEEGAKGEPSEPAKPVVVLSLPGSYVSQPVSNSGALSALLTWSEEGAGAGCCEEVARVGYLWATMITKPGMGESADTL